MRTLAATISLCALLAQGCYLGRSRPAKTIAYVANGAIVATGIGVLATSPSASHSYGGQGWAGDLGGAAWSGVDRDVHMTVGTGLLLVGLVGAVINLATTTEHDAAPVPAPLATAPQQVKLQIGHDLSPRSIALAPSAP